MSQQRNAVAIIGAGALLIGGIAGVFAFGGYRINLTPSYNLGLWRIEALARPVQAGDRIFICPPDGEAVTLALQRLYLPRGLCPSGSGPLIKTVVAVAGQLVEIDGDVRIDGKPLPSSRILEVDAEDRAMPIYSGGIVSEGTVFLHSDYIGSYDSRYFGPIPVSGTLGLAREVLTFIPSSYVRPVALPLLRCSSPAGLTGKPCLGAHSRIYIRI